jgi:hypothetical protein
VSETYEEDPIVLASNYRLIGVNFQASAKTLLETMEVNEDGSPARYTSIPFYFLVSHAAELFLKSALLKRAFTGKELKKYDYRHDLNALLKSLQEKGVKVSPDAIELITSLQDQHKAYALRYSVFGGYGRKRMPRPHPALEILDELMMLTRISTQGV